jgi:hypothetical protein
MRAMSRMPYWACLAIVVGSMVVNGWLAEWEDNRPGGFNNPTPDERTAPSAPPAKTSAKD